MPEENILRVLSSLVSPIKHTKLICLIGTTKVPSRGIKDTSASFTTPFQQLSYKLLKWQKEWTCSIPRPTHSQHPFGFRRKDVQRYQKDNWCFDQTYSIHSWVYRPISMFDVLSHVNHGQFGHAFNQIFDVTKYTLSHSGERVFQVWQPWPKI